MNNDGAVEEHINVQSQSLFALAPQERYWKNGQLHEDYSWKNGQHASLSCCKIGQSVVQYHRIKGHGG